MLNHDIDKQVVRKIRQIYSLDDEQKFSRISHQQTLGIAPLTPEQMLEIDAYKIHVEACIEWGKQEKVKNDLARRTDAYNLAVIRLSRPIKEFGRPEKIVEPVLDEFDNVIEEGYTIKAIEPIEPLMLTRDVYEVDSDIWVGTEEYLNPIIEQDRQSRADAQTIVDAGLPV